METEAYKPPTAHVSLEAASPTVLTFYAQAHWGTRYGVEDAAHKTPHKGLDVGLFHGFVDVPALHAGVVVTTAAVSTVGHIVQVRRADGLFDTYAHIVIGVKVGERVVQGQRLGRQAVDQAEGGTQWLGQHTHLCLSRTAAAWGVWDADNLDPTPGVIAVLTAAAGGGGTPINEKGPTMYAFSYTSASAGVVTFIAEPGLYVKGCAETEPAALGIPVSGPLSLNDLNAAMWDLGFDDMVGGTVDAWTFLSQHCVPGKTVYTTAWQKAQAGATLTDAQIAAIAAKIVIPVVDLTPVLTAVAALDTQADNYQTALVQAVQGAAASIPGATLDLEAARLKS